MNNKKGIESEVNLDPHQSNILNTYQFSLLKYANDSKVMTITTKSTEPMGLRGLLHAQRQG